MLDAAAAVHYYEAILATLAILIWHMYSVVFDPHVYPLDRVRLRDSANVTTETEDSSPLSPGVVPPASNSGDIRQQAVKRKKLQEGEGPI